MAIEKVHDLKGGKSAKTLPSREIKGSRERRIFWGWVCDASCHSLADILAAGLASASTFMFNHISC